MGDMSENMECVPLEDMKSESENSEHSDSMNVENVESEKDNTKTSKKVYLPGEKLEEGEELVVDKSAYRMLHHAQSGAPCLSFDVISDKVSTIQEKYPLSMYLVAGTQAGKTHVNNLLVIRMTNIYGNEEDEDDDSDNDSCDSDDNNRSPVMSVASIIHHGCVNRVRCTKIQDTTLAASWSELGRVNIWNLNKQLEALEDSALLSAYHKKCQKFDTVKPLFTFKGHLVEGYAVDWSNTEPGTLATGDCKGNIHIWRVNDKTCSTWHVDQRPYNSHAPHSVEDLQWSPNEKNVLASCSVDKSIKIWDTRVSPQSACMLTASGTHTADINVISWNRIENQFLLSGGDDGLICVWDLRQFNANGSSPVAVFKQHLAPVTTVEWHPEEATVFASGGSDDQIVQWDLSVEVDSEETSEDPGLSKLPPQLLFIHQGQTDIKELHWHPQCPGVIISTAHSGFNVFRTISV